MERIKERSMTTYIVSSLINAGIGLAVGLIVGIILAIIYDSAYMILTNCMIFTAIFALYTANMYRIYFYYRLSMDVNAVCEGDGVQSASYTVAAILSFLTLGIYNLFWLYRLAQRVKVNAPRYGFKIVEGGKDIVVLNVLSFGFAGAYEMIKNMNRIAKVYNRSGLAPIADESLFGGVQ